ncbi:hypothetical protein AC579_6938 [Pseudocercospora musae]|uniref:Uncharacterized protein n=1 Tax=Pseudocercospora musae TaxID=113226 RepID=A0A139INH3_9PEZI|nr:hypothetical protein AC579_6938 [Pseudocercospora musae]
MTESVRSKPPKRERERERDRIMVGGSQQCKCGTGTLDLIQYTPSFPHYTRRPASLGSQSAWRTAQSRRPRVSKSFTMLWTLHLVSVEPVCLRAS